MKNADDVKLSERKCKACNAETPPLGGQDLEQYRGRLDEGWELVDDHHLRRTFRFKNFRQALDFTVRIGEMSEQEGHHPDIELSWGKVTLTVYTHAIDALSENDFIWAAKADVLFKQDGA